MLLISPLLALLPAAWRARFALSSRQWRVATAISALAEATLSVIALVYWYSYSVSRWAGAAISSASAINPRAAAVPEQGQGFAGLLLVLLHPLTWIFLVALVEGMARLLFAAVGGEAHGSLFFWGIRRIWLLRQRDRATDDVDGQISEDIDRTRSSQGILEIRVLTAKQGWEAGKIVRFETEYYQVAELSKDFASRRFVYVLQRISRR